MEASKYYKLIWGLNLLGGNLRVNGKKRTSGVYFGANEALPRCEGLHSHTDHQQENQHQIFPGRKYRGTVHIPLHINSLKSVWVENP